MMTNRIIIDSSIFAIITFGILLLCCVAPSTATDGEFGLISPQNLNITDDFGYFDIASNGENYLVVWNTRTDIIKGQFVTKTGSFLGSSFTISDGIGYVPKVASNGNDYFVVWVQSGTTIKGTLVTGLGSVSSPVTINIASGNEFFYECEVVSDGENFLVITNPKNVIGQRIDSSGALLGSQFQISPIGNTKNKRTPSATFGNNKYFVVWKEFNGDWGPLYGQIDYDIYGAILNSDGTVLNTQIPIYIGADTTILGDPIISYGLDSSLIVWNSIVSIPKVGLEGVREARISNDGTLLNPQNGTLLSGVSAVAECDISFDGTDWILVGSMGYAYRITQSGIVRDSCQTSSSLHPKIAFDGTNFLVIFLNYDYQILQSQFLTTSNQPPIANAGADITTYRYSPKILDGSGSYDPEGYYPLNCQWTLVSTSPGSSGYLKSSINNSIELSTGSQPGTFIIQLIVRDFVGAVSPPDNVTITAVNLPHELDPIGNKTVIVNELLQFQLSATNPDGDPLYYTHSWPGTIPQGYSFNSSNGSFSWIPQTIGTYPCIFGVSDNLQTDSERISIIVKPQNNEPIADDQIRTTAEETSVSITLTATDLDNNPLTYSLVDFPVYGTLSGIAPTLIYTPMNNYNGADTFTFKANDGTTDSNTATISIYVNPVNDAPVAKAQSVTFDEDGATPIALTSTDDDNDPLTYTIINGPTHGILSGAAPSLTYTPTADYSGTDSFTFKANDGTVDSNTAAVSITINAMNDIPVADDQSVSIPEDTLLVISLIGSDVDGDPLTYSAISGPAHGILSGTAPSLTYTPTADYSGTDSFTFKANDGTIDSNTATVSISVIPVNDAPIISIFSLGSTDPISLTDLVTPTIAVLDVDGNSNPPIINWGDGTIDSTLTHQYTSTGVYTLILNVSDSSGASASAVYEYAVIYNPNVGFVSGHGTIWSPVNTSYPYMQYEGKARFGFVSKYEKGANIPTGSTAFQFKSSDLDFESVSYQWLVVAGARAQYKGTGTINDEGNYGFLLTAIDGAVAGGGDADKFRIKIWDISSDDTIVYDNLAGMPDGSNPTTVIETGNIIIHK